MKIVINKCYGGFGLSPKAIARLAELRGQKAYFFVGGIGSRPRVQVPMEEATGLFWYAYNTPTPKPSPTAAEWAEMSLDDRIVHNAAANTEDIDDSRNNRTDPLLIQVVEELGDEASGRCAELRIIEIPDGIDYDISEYDGMESVEEKHRSWS